MPKVQKNTARRQAFPPQKPRPGARDAGGPASGLGLSAGEAAEILQQLHAQKVAKDFWAAKRHPCLGFAVAVEVVPPAPIQKPPARRRRGGRSTGQKLAQRTQTVPVPLAGLPKLSPG